MRKGKLRTWGPPAHAIREARTDNIHSPKYTFGILICNSESSSVACATRVNAY